MSLPISLLSLSKAAAVAFFSLRVREYADPTPPLVSNLLPVFVVYIFVVTPHMIVWSLVVAYFREMALVAAALTVMLTAVLPRCFNVRYKNVK